MNRVSVFVPLLSVLFVSVTRAQPLPDPDLWGGGVTNPSGEQAVPAVVYEPSTGLMYLNTAGINGVVDTTSGSLVGGDDVGMISLLVTGPCANSVFLDGFVPSEYGGGVVWGPIGFGGCAGGHQQLGGASVGVQYLDPSARTEVFQYDAGLTPDDFGHVEMGVNFQSGARGELIFGCVQFVPEPEMTVAGLGLIVIWLCRVAGPCHRSKQRKRSSDQHR